MTKISEPYVKVAVTVRDTPSLLNIDGSANLGGVVISPKGKGINFISGPKDFLKKLVGAEELPRNAHVSLVNAYYCSYFAGLVVARALNTQATAGILIDLDKAGNIQYINMLNNTILNSTAYLKFDIDTLLEEKSDWAIVINNTCFYHATEAEYNKHIAPYYIDATNATAIYCESINDVIKGINSWSGFNAYSGADDNADEGSEPNIIIEFNDSIGLNASEFIRIASRFYKRGAQENFNANTCIKTTGIESYVAITRASESTIPNNYLMIACTEASESNDYQISIHKFDNPSASDDVYTLALNRGDEQQIFYISLNPDSHNQDGENCFIENYNPQLEDIQFILSLQDETIHKFPSDSLTTRQFGNSGVNLTTSKDAAYFSAALNRLAEQKQYRIEQLSDFGMTESTYIKDYAKIGRYKFWFTPIDLPYSYSNAAAMMIFGNGIANHRGSLIAGPFDRKSTFLAWPVKIAWSSMYWERVYTNRANNSEYAPAFDLTNGRLNYSDPVYSLGETDRTMLLNATSGPINFVIFDQLNNAYYLNDNRCHTTENNVASEEMNVRMIYRIAKDMLELLSHYKGRTNTASTRSDVESEMRSYMDNNIMTQNYKPEEYQVQCNEVNNTTELITANKLKAALKIRLLGSVKFIEVPIDVFPLGVDFTN